MHCSIPEAWELLNHLLVLHRGTGIVAVRSGHTIDIIASGVSKDPQRPSGPSLGWPSLPVHWGQRATPRKRLRVAGHAIWAELWRGIVITEALLGNLARPGAPGTHAAEYYLRAIRPHRSRKTFGLSLGGKV